MNSAGHHPWRRWRRVLSRAVFAVSVAFLLSGCGTVWKGNQWVGPVYSPQNVYRHADQLSERVKRVAVLPLTPSDSTGSLEAGIDALEPILQSELGKSQRFEIVRVTAEQLNKWTGKASWKANEALPADMLERVRAGTGCDAILFAELTVFQAYPPVAVGWKFNLIDCAADRKASILWSADEILDSGDPTVARGARAYYSQDIGNRSFAPDSTTVLHSPRQFGQYSLNTVLATLPTR